jgi:hypothetical protein
MDVVVMWLLEMGSMRGSGDARVGEEQRDAEVHQFFQLHHVVLGHGEPGDDQNVVGVSESVELAQDLEKMGLDAGEKRVRGLVEDLDRSDAWLEGVVRGQELDGVIGGAEQVRGPDIEVSPEVPDAVSAVERASDDVVEGET